MRAMAPLPSDRVLLADGDPGLRRQIGKRLLDASIFADSADDGRAAVDLLGERTYALIVLGFELPNRGAERVLEFVRTLEPGSRPVVLVVGEPSAARSLDVDLVQIVLRTPCNLTQLADMIQSCVRSGNARSQDGVGRGQTASI
jgi:DNA-binding response OmpR family regulator